MTNFPPSKHMKRLHETISGLNAQDVSDAQKEIGKALEEDSLPTPEVKETNPEDIRQAGAIATDFMAGMDKVSTVLMVLVMKFGRATTMMRLVLVLMAVGLCLFMVSLMTAYSVNARLEMIQETQQDIVRQLDDVTQKASKAAEKAEQAKAQSKKAELAAEKAEQASPRVIVDEKGNPKLVVPKQTVQVRPDESELKAPKEENSSEALEFDLSF